MKWCCQKNRKVFSSAESSFAIKVLFYGVVIPAIAENKLFSLGQGCFSMYPSHGIVNGSELFI